MACPHCGSVISRGSVSCGNCGAEWRRSLSGMAFGLFLTGLGIALVLQGAWSSGLVSGALGVGTLKISGTPGWRPKADKKSGGRPMQHDWKNWKGSFAGEGEILR